MPEFLREHLKQTKNYYLVLANQDAFHQLHGYLKLFLHSVSSKFFLRAAGHETVLAMVQGSANDGKSVAGFILNVPSPEKLVRETRYSIEAERSDGPFHFEIEPGVGLTP